MVSLITTEFMLLIVDELAEKLKNQTKQLNKMTITEFEEITIKELEAEQVEYKSFIVGIEKPQGQPEEYSVFLIMDEENNHMGVHITPLLAIQEAIGELESDQITQQDIDNELAKNL